jgi:hypothetical protein
MLAHLAGLVALQSTRSPQTKPLGLDEVFGGSLV